MKIISQISPAGLILLAVAVSGYFIYTATVRSPTTLEGILLQFFILAASVTGSWLLGRRAVVNRIHARSAFRRVTSLYWGLARAAAVIEGSRYFDTAEDYRVAFARLEELVRNQLVTVDDALDDWRDIVPEDERDVWGGRFPPDSNAGVNGNEANSGESCAGS